MEKYFEQAVCKNETRFFFSGEATRCVFSD